MGNVIIKADNLSKKYTISRRAPGDTLSAHILGRMKNLLALRSPFDTNILRKEELWPVREVSFEISTGEIVGIIGRNGAGKSTLLKILSRIIDPTSGRAEIRGRVGTLLEVGTGFHPELTGRENIYLSGIILGMKRAEIAKKFDEIVEFSGVSKFVDTPVKRYSSGMYVRLAFAVGAHLEPEILIVDEVLAVGDTQFQKKCLDKMRTIGSEGRTVLFVSHNLEAVARLCDRAIVMREGKVVYDGKVHEAVSAYHGDSSCSMAVREWIEPSDAPTGEFVRLRAVRVKSDEGRIEETLDVRGPIGIEMDYEVLKPGSVLAPHFQIVNDAGELIFITQDLDPAWKRRTRPTGLYRSYVEIPGNLLTEGKHYVGCYCITLSPDIVQFESPSAVTFQVIDKCEGDTARGDYSGPMPGMIRPLLKWRTQMVETEQWSAVSNEPY
jgi:lipopolysaccharide transport system ATP-binding protein